MANDFSLLKVVDLVESKDDDGNPRISLKVREFEPRQFSINLSKATPEKINAFKSLIGKAAMIPTREGSFNGRMFVSLEEGSIIPVPTQKVSG